MIVITGYLKFCNIPLKSICSHNAQYLTYLLAVKSKLQVNDTQSNCQLPQHWTEMNNVNLFFFYYFFKRVNMIRTFTQISKLSVYIKIKTVSHD